VQFVHRRYRLRVCGVLFREQVTVAAGESEREGMPAAIIPLLRLDLPVPSGGLRAPVRRICIPESVRFAELASSIVDLSPHFEKPGRHTIEADAPRFRGP